MTNSIKSIINRKSMNEPSWAGYFLFLVAACFIIYSNLPNTALLFSRRTTLINIEKISESHLEFAYQNEFTDQTYSFTREISPDEFTRINQQKAPAVSYSALFPATVFIQGIDSEKSYLSLVIDAIIIFTLVKAARGLHKKQ